MALAERPINPCEHHLLRRKAGRRGDTPCAQYGVKPEPLHLSGLDHVEVALVKRYSFATMRELMPLFYKGAITGVVRFSWRFVGV